MVRDELDVLPVVLDHLLEQGVDHVLVADNLSTDGTYEYLCERAAQDPRVHVARDTTVAYYQSAKMTVLARAAQRTGADWIVPFDADELWFARDGCLADSLRVTDADVIGADWYDMILRSCGPIDRDSEYLMDVTPNPLRKLAFRADRFAVLGIGNHTVVRTGARVDDGLAVAHARYRSLKQVERKFRQGAAAMAASGADPHLGGQWRRGAELAPEALTRMWAAMCAGQSAPEIDWFATGPMVPVRPGRWSRWSLGDAVADSSRS